MNHDIESITGLIFTHTDTGEEFGCIRPRVDAPDHPARRTRWEPIAEDDCGNAFIVSPDGAVAFWDHETDDIIPLAADWPTFVRGCAVGKPVILDPSKIKSVWIDPSFAKEHGIDVDNDGWKKSP